MENPLTSPSVEQMRERGSLKWSAYGDALGLWVAESDFGTAPVVRATLQKWVGEDNLGYLPPWLTQEMAYACAGFMQRHYGWTIDSANIKPVADVLAGLEVIVREFTRPGSPIVVPTPAYMPFLTLPNYLGRPVIEVPMVRDARQRWTHDLGEIQMALEAGAGLVLLCNPHNPLGRVFDRQELQDLCDVVAGYDARIFADEIHAPIRFDNHKHIPFAAISETAAQISITATSTSKAFNAPGLKAAQVLLTAECDIEKWRNFGWFAEHGAGTLGVAAATSAYAEGDGWLEHFNRTLSANRDLLESLLETHLPQARYEAPEGTYLAWLDLQEYGPRERWAAWLRSRADVAAVDGTACGVIGAGHVRLNFATSPKVLATAFERLGSALASSG